MYVRGNVLSSARDVLSSPSRGVDSTFRADDSASRADDSTFPRTHTHTPGYRCQRVTSGGEGSETPW